MYSCVFHKLFKVTKIFIYTPLMTKDMSTILLGANILTEARYIGTLFQNGFIKRSKYIRRFPFIFEIRVVFRFYLSTLQINILTVSKFTVPRYTNTICEAKRSHRKNDSLIN